MAGRIDLTDCRMSVEVKTGPNDVCIFLDDDRGQTSEGFCLHPDDAPRLAALLAGPALAVVPREVLARLAEYVEANEASLAAWTERDNPHFARFLDARKALHEGDLPAVRAALATEGSKG